MFEFTIPDSFNQTALNIKLLKLMKTRPEMFYDDFKIASTFGCPEGVIWNGGGIDTGSRSNKEIRLAIEKYKELGVTYWFTFTNRLLKDEHMMDTYGNKVAEIANEYHCGALVSNDIMEKHLRKNYPNLRIIQSICRCEYSIEGINNYSKRDLTVIPIRFNNDFNGALKEFKYPENLEVLTNESCIEKCPYNKTHYESFNRYTLRECDTYHVCKFPSENKPELLPYKKHYVPRELFHRYEELGIYHMKISGRRNGLKLIPIYLQMFVKPQYREFVDMKLNLFNENEDWNWEKDDANLNPITKN